MGLIEHWKLMADWVMPVQGGPAQPLTIVIGPPIPPGEKVEVVRADAYREAVADRDHFERALERIFHGSEDHAWEDAGKALDTRPSRRGGQ
jgi:hypothetical protein